MNVVITGRDQLGKITKSIGAKAKNLVPIGVAPSDVFWVCVRCLVVKDASRFYLKPTKRGDGLKRSTCWCKACHSEAAVKREAIRSRRRRHWLDKYKEAVGCSSCGYKTHAIALEFHHPNEKVDGVAGMMSHSLKRLFEEIRRCVVVCARCHRVAHQIERRRDCA